MKRLPVLLSFGCFLLLCASVAVWGMRMFKGQARGVSSSVVQQSFEPAAGMWGGIFGESQSAQNAPSSYLLKGVILSRAGLPSVALVVADGKPAKPVRVGEDIVPGVQVREISARSVQFAEGGVLRRIELPQGNVTAANGIVAPVAENSGASITNYPVRNISGAVTPPPPPQNVPMVVPGVPVASMPAVMGAN